MHATIPALPNSIRQLVITGSRAGELSGELTGLFDRLAGRLVAQGMAKLIELGFGFLICEGLSDDKAEKARASEPPFFSKAVPSPVSGAKTLKV